MVFMCIRHTSTGLRPTTKRAKCHVAWGSDYVGFCYGTVLNPCNGRRKLFDVENKLNHRQVLLQQCRGLGYALLDVECGPNPKPGFLSFTVRTEGP